MLIPTPQCTIQDAPGETLTVACLYVIADGPYSQVPNAELWPEDRDARKYHGPWPVVAHPPCQRWGRYATRGGNKLGDDGGCALSAVEAVRTWGGVLEHPAYSKLWQWADLPQPGERDSSGGTTIHIHQHPWGHPALKPTWLYVLPAGHLAWPPGSRAAPRPCEDLSLRQRQSSPLALAHALVDLARRVVRQGVVR